MTLSLSDKITVAHKNPLHIGGGGGAAPWQRGTFHPSSGFKGQLEVQVDRK